MVTSDSSSGLDLLLEMRQARIKALKELQEERESFIKRAGDSTLSAAGWRGIAHPKF